MKKDYSKPFLSVDIFTPEEFVAACNPDTMYTINPVSYSPGEHKQTYMRGANCNDCLGPVVPNHEPINISKDAYPKIMAILNKSQKWSLGKKSGNHYEDGTGYIYYSIATSSNSYGGNITSANVETFHATLCDDNASSNALIVLNAEGGITINRS